MATALPTPGVTTEWGDQLNAYLTEQAALLAGARGTAINAAADFQVGAGGSDNGRFASALAAAVAAKKPLILPPTMLIDGGGVTLPSGADIRGFGTTIDVSGLNTNAAAFNITGTISAKAGFTSAPTRGTTTLSIANSGLAAGDVVKVMSDDLWGIDRNQKYGELVTVASATSSAVTLYAPLSSSYTTNAQWQKVTPTDGVKIQGIKFLGAQATTSLAYGVRTLYARDITVSGCAFKYVHYAGIRFEDTVTAKVTGCDFSDALDTTLAYGVVITFATQDVIISHCTGRHMRHLITVGGGTGWGVPRRIKGNSCVAVEMRNAGFDTHSGSNDVTYTDCHVNGVFGDGAADGFIAQGANVKFDGCTASNTTRDGFRVENYSAGGMTATLTGCTSREAGGNGFMFLGRDPAVSPGNTSFVDVIVQGCRAFRPAGNGFNFDSENTATVLTGVTFNGNIVDTAGGNSLYINGWGWFTGSGNLFKNLPANTYVVSVNNGNESALGFTAIGSGTWTSGGGLILSNASGFTLMSGSRMKNVRTPVTQPLNSPRFMAVGCNFQGNVNDLSLATPTSNVVANNIAYNAT